MTFTKDIPERDWKTLRKLKQELLNPACEHILAKAEALLANGEENPYETLQNLEELINKGHEDIKFMFGDTSRSNAIIQLGAMFTRNLITTEMLQQFSEETQAQMRYFKP